MKRTFAVTVVFGVFLGYALISGGAIDLSPTPEDDPPRSHEVEVRAMGGDATNVTVTVVRHGSIVLERQFLADDTFGRVLRLQGTGEFTVVVSTSGDSTSVDVERPRHYQHCSGDIHLRFSVESEEVYVSTEEDPGRCVSA